jgi:hypothetical protein
LIYKLSQLFNPVTTILLLLSALASAYLAGLAHLGFPDGTGNMTPIYVYPGICFSLMFLVAAVVRKAITLKKAGLTAIFFVPLTTIAYVAAVTIAIGKPEYVGPPYSFIVAGGTGAALVWFVTQILKFKFQIRSLALTTLLGLIGGLIFFLVVQFFKPSFLEPIISRSIAYICWQIPVGLCLIKRLIGPAQ